MCVEHMGTVSMGIVSEVGLHHRLHDYSPAAERRSRLFPATRGLQRSALQRRVHTQTPVLIFLAALLPVFHNVTTPGSNVQHTMLIVILRQGEDVFRGTSERPSRVRSQAVIPTNKTSAAAQYKYVIAAAKCFELLLR